MRSIFSAVALAVLIYASVCPAVETPAGDPAAATARKEAEASKASVEPANKETAAGVALLKHGDYRKAALVLREVVKAAPDDQEANFYLGVALNRLSEKEAESVLKRSLMQMPESPYVNFELGVFYFAKEIDAEAGDYFENVLTLNPDSAYAAQAREYLQRIEVRGREKRWELNVLAGMQYDSNVMVIGDGPLPAGVSRKSDWNGMVNAKGSYRLIKNQDTELTGGYSLYQTLHTELTGFDVTQNVVDLSLLRTVAPKLRLKAGYSFEYLFLGGDRYDIAHTLAPGLIYSTERWGSSALDYRYRTTSYTNSAAFTNNTDRNGDNHYVGITQTVPVGKSYSVWAGYSHDEDLTRTKSWNYHGDRVAAGVRATLPHDSMADLSGDHYHKRYAAEDPSSPGTVRDDDQFTAAFTVMKVLSPTFTLMAMEQYTRTLSNIGTFDTVRTVTSMFINARF